MSEKIKRSDAEWREILTPEQYTILREKLTGRYVNEKRDGIYQCVACGQALFSSLVY
ncbi:MAG: peptide-methionine (R)-S-oxide reductase [Anaerolineae bacterium]